jgi:hypothetical protein
MRLLRPYIPVSVRWEVLERQFGTTFPRRHTKSELDRMLRWFFSSKPVQLDHEPALALRRLTSTGRYIPSANNPRYLVYRLKEKHRTKTLVRGDHGQFSDIALIRRQKRRKLKSQPDKPAWKWPKRKLPSRPMREKQT